jgi:hypothetical protein
MPRKLTEVPQSDIETIHRLKYLGYTNRQVTEHFGGKYGFSIITRIAKTFPNPGEGAVLLSNYTKNPKLYKILYKHLMTMPYHMMLGGKRILSEGHMKYNTKHQCIVDDEDNDGAFFDVISRIRGITIDTDMYEMIDGYDEASD